MKIEAIVICVNRSGPLEICLANNLQFLDHLIVVTTKDDVKTQALVPRYQGKVSLLITDRFSRDGNTFDLGAPYSKALEYLRHRDWVLLMGADIILHNYFRVHLQRRHLDIDSLYGCNRINVMDLADLQRLTRDELDEPKSTKEWGFGYFQLFNIKSRFLRGASPLYPSNSDGSYSDYLFRKRFGGPHHFDGKRWHWDERHQGCLTLPCFHLGNAGVVYSTAPQT